MPGGVRGCPRVPGGPVGARAGGRAVLREGVGAGGGVRSPGRRQELKAARGGASPAVSPGQSHHPLRSAAVPAAARGRGQPSGDAAAPSGILRSAPPASRAQGRAGRGRACGGGGARARTERGTGHLCGPCWAGGYRHGRAGLSGSGRRMLGERGERGALCARSRAPASPPRRGEPRRAGGLGCDSAAGAGTRGRRCRGRRGCGGCRREGKGRALPPERSIRDSPARAGSAARPLSQSRARGAPGDGARAAGLPWRSPQQPLFVCSWPSELPGTCQNTLVNTYSQRGSSESSDFRTSQWKGSGVALYRLRIRPLPCLVSPRLSPDKTPSLLSAPAALSHSHNSPWKLFCSTTAKGMRRFRALSVISPAAGQQSIKAPQPLPGLGSFALPRALQTQPRMKSTN